MRHEILGRRGPLTVVTTAILVGLYVLYGLAMGALIRPPQFRPEVAAAGPVKVANRLPRENERMARLHLADKPWVADAPFRVRTADAFLYWDQCEIAKTEDSVEFEPFAMIWVQKDQTADEPPITIVADKAYMKFSSKFSIENPNPSRVIEGALRGKVEIRGPDNLHVVGGTFYFSEKDMQIFSAERVEFEQGPHRGEAQGVDIYLARDPNVGGEDKLAIAGVDSVLLRKYVKLQLQFEPPPAQNEKQPRQAANAETSPPAEPVQVHVESAGSFRFSVKDSIATFEDQVVVHHPDPKDPNLYDRMLCDLLTLVFEKVDPEAKPGDSASPAAPDAAAAPPVETADAAKASNPGGQSSALGSLGGIDANLAFRKLTASGKKVVLISEGNQLQAQMTQLDYDAVQKLISLKDSEAVVVTQAASKMQCPQITLVHGDDGRVSYIWCQGAGWLKQHDAATGQIQLAARWKKQLRKYPEKDSTLDIIEIDQQALVEQPAEGFKLAAEFIKLWVDPNGTAAGLPSSMVGEQTAGRFRPDRLLAEENVAFGTPKMNGQAQKLQVWFEQRSAVPIGPALEVPKQSHLQILRGDRVASAESRLQLTSYRAPPAPNRRPVQRPPRSQYSVPPEGAAAQNTTSQPQPQPTVARDPFVPAPQSPGGTARAAASNTAARGGAAAEETLPVDVSADLIRIRVLQGDDPKDTTVADVWTYGNVRVAQPQPKGTLRELKGEKLEIENRSAQDQVLRVFGNNASIRDGGLIIEGPDISFDRVRNVVTVSGAGTLAFPVTQMPDGTPLEVPQKLDVWWKERMVFDGMAANFYGKVRAILNENTMKCAQMEVVLTKPISFAEGASQDDADVAMIVCKDGVLFESKQMENNVLSAFHKGDCAEFTLDQQTGETTARGPGWIDSWRRGRTDPADLVGPARVRSNASLKPDPNLWTYTRVEFSGRMSGNLTRKFTRFHDRVHIVYGPVDRPSVVLDPDDLPKDGGEMRSDTLDLTQLKSPEAEKTYIEALARGNVKLSGQSFQARADEVSYDESKGFYILRGEGNRDASLYRQVKLGGERDSIDAKELHFNPTTSTYKVVRASGAIGAG